MAGVKRPVVDNIESTARDHLANERTFLAWVRTALAVVGLGVLVGKLVETDGVVAEILGLLMIAFGAGMLIYGITRVERVTALLDEHKFASARRGPFVLAALGIIISVGAAVLLLV